MLRIILFLDLIGFLSLLTIGVMSFTRLTIYAEIVCDLGPS